jgi:hypothetical protein
MNWKKIAALLGAILAWLVALGGLALAVLHFREIRKTAHELTDVRQSLAGDLRKIQSSLSTQYAGDFPDFIEQIIQSVGAAQHDVAVLCDFPAYADFSERSLALKLRGAIEQRLQAGVKVKIICLNAKRRLKALHEQFRRENFDRDDPVWRERVQRYVGRPDGAPTITYDEFIKVLQENNDMIIKQTYRNAEVLQVDADVPIFFWISDSRAGVMAVQTAGGENEYGFKTADLALINALLASRDRYKQPQGVTR